MSRERRHFYEFGPYLIDVREQSLLREGRPVSLPPKVFETLRALVENGGRVLKKDELMGRVWPDTFVEEANLTVGGTQQFTARVVSPTGETIDAPVTFRVVPARVASVDATGLVTALDPGIATLRATSGMQSVVARIRSPCSKSKEPSP